MKDQDSFYEFVDKTIFADAVNSIICIAGISDYFVKSQIILPNKLTEMFYEHEINKFPLEYDGTNPFWVLSMVKKTKYKICYFVIGFLYDDNNQISLCFKISFLGENYRTVSFYKQAQFLYVLRELLEQI